MFKIISGYGFLTILILELATLLTTKAAIPETSMTYLKFYDTQLQWNDAFNFCKSRGEILFNEETRVRESAITGVIAFLNGYNYLVTDIWLGLHNIHYNESNYFYKWSDCSDTTSWNKLPPIDESLENPHCVSLDPNDLTWGITNCSLKLHVICESPIPCNCSLEIKTDESPKLVSTIGVMKNSSSLGECKKLCLEHVRGTGECWGVTFNYDDYTCHIHESIVSEPYNYGENLVYFSKICYQALIFTNVNPLETPPNDFPKDGCTENDVAPTDAPCDYKYLLPSVTSTPVISTTDDVSITISTNEQTTQTFNNNTTDVLNMCFCPCSVPPDIPLEQQIDLLVKDLSIDKSNTSLERRRKYSVGDTRISAQSIGYAGVFVLIFIVSGIILLDVARLKNDVTKGLNNVHGFMCPSRFHKCP